MLNNSPSLIDQCEASSGGVYMAAKTMVAFLHQNPSKKW